MISKHRNLHSTLKLQRNQKCSEEMSKEENVDMELST